MVAEIRCFSLKYDIRAVSRKGETACFDTTSHDLNSVQI